MASLPSLQAVVMVHQWPVSVQRKCECRCYPLGPSAVHKLVWQAACRLPQLPSCVPHFRSTALWSFYHNHTCVLSTFIDLISLHANTDLQPITCCPTALNVRFGTLTYGGSYTINDIGVVVRITSYASDMSKVFVRLCRRGGAANCDEDPDTWRGTGGSGRFSV